MRKANDGAGGVEASKLDGLSKNVEAVLRSVEDCLKNKRVLSSLVLLYTIIDVVSSLERGDDEGTKAAFVRWVDQHLLPDAHIHCSALDLYAARCGILHSFSSESDLSRKKNVRPLIYAWGSADVSKLQKSADLLGRSDIAVHIDDLLACFRKALAAYLIDVQTDHGRFSRAARSAGLWLQDMNVHMVNEFVERFD